MKDIFNRSIIIFIFWMAAIFIFTAVQSGDQAPLNILVKENLLAGNFAALIILFSFWYLNRFSLKVGFKTVPPAKAWALLWFPMLFVFSFLISAVYRGLPAGQAFLFIFINTLLVGISEEFMFRGILLSAALTRFSIWKAIWFVTVIFGLVHSLNGFITGDFVSASIQSIAAMMTGYWLIALRIRMKSLYPPILIHFLWDFSLFLTTANTPESQEEISLLVQLLVPVLIVMPLFLYGFFLLRKKHFPRTIDA